MVKARALRSRHVRTKNERKAAKRKQKKEPKALGIWNGKESYTSNYASNQIILNPNMESRKVEKLKEEHPERSLEKLEKIMPKAPVPKQGKLCFIVHEAERKILQDLIDKYGDNYKAMAWDTDLNMNQWTPKQLEHRIKKYLIYKKQLEYEQESGKVKGPVAPIKRFKEKLIGNKKKYPKHDYRNPFF
ncbi:hypothetical protein ABK040_003708 [Willaertia magna]